MNLHNKPQEKQNLYLAHSGNQVRKIKLNQSLDDIHLNIQSVRPNSKRNHKQNYSHLQIQYDPLNYYIEIDKTDSVDIDLTVELDNSSYNTQLRNNKPYFSQNYNQPKEVPNVNKKNSFSKISLPKNKPHSNHNDSSINQSQISEKKDDLKQKQKKQNKLSNIEINPTLKIPNNKCYFPDDKNQKNNKKIIQIYDQQFDYIQQGHVGTINTTPGYQKNNKQQNFGISPPFFKKQGKISNSNYIYDSNNSIHQQKQLSDYDRYQQQQTKPITFLKNNKQKQRKVSDIQIQKNSQVSSPQKIQFTDNQKTPSKGYFQNPNPQTPSKNDHPHLLTSSIKQPHQKPKIFTNPTKIYPNLNQQEDQLKTHRKPQVYFSINNNIQPLQHQRQYLQSSQKQQTNEIIYIPIDKLPTNKASNRTSKHKLKISDISNEEPTTPYQRFYTSYHPSSQQLQYKQPSKWKKDKHKLKTQNLPQLSKSNCQPLSLQCSSITNRVNKNKINKQPYQKYSQQNVDSAKNHPTKQQIYKILNELQEDGNHDQKLPVFIDLICNHLKFCQNN